MEAQDAGFSSTSQKTLISEDAFSVTVESPHVQESNNNAQDVNNENVTNKNPWKKFSEIKIQTEPVMGTLSWPELSSRTQSIEELPSSKAIIASSTPGLSVLGTKTIDADSSSSISLCANVSSSTVSSEVSITVYVPSSSNSEAEKTFSSSSSQSSPSSLTCSGSPFNHSDNSICQPADTHPFPSHRRGNGFNVKRGNRWKNGFRNQNRSNRHQPSSPFNNWNLNSGFNPLMNPKQQQSSFLNGPAGFFGPPPIMNYYTYSVNIPTLPYNMQQIYMPPHGCYGDWYHPEAVFCPPMPHVEVTGGSMLTPPPQPANQLPSLNSPPRPPNKLAPFDNQFQQRKQMPYEDAEIFTKILNQVEYYFSKENLVKDHHLRSKCMDGEGWVHVTSIAKFKKIQEITRGDTKMILKAVRLSTVVEVKGEKLRRRGDWKLWVLQPQYSSRTHPPQEMLLTGIQNIQIDGQSREVMESSGNL